MFLNMFSPQRKQCRESPSSAENPGAAGAQGDFGPALGQSIQNKSLLDFTDSQLLPQ